MSLKYEIICRRISDVFINISTTFILAILLVVNDAWASGVGCIKNQKNAASAFQPDRKITRGKWSSEIHNPSSRIILSAGHVNRVSGSTGFNNGPPLYLHGHKHTTESALVKIITPYMVEIGQLRGFDVEQFVARSTVFRNATLELANYEKKVNGIAFEIHSDAPSEGYHRAAGYDGHTGIIPPVDGTITIAEACAGNYLGKFKKGVRGLFAPKQGISLFELFPTNKGITQAIQHGIKFNNFRVVKQLVLPYIHLFYDALEMGGIKPNKTKLITQR